jgi:hypothetical protein
MLLFIAQVYAHEYLHSNRPKSKSVDEYVVSSS